MRGKSKPNRKNVFNVCKAFLDIPGAMIELHRWDDITLVLSEDEYGDLEMKTAIPNFDKVRSSSQSIQLKLPVRLKAGNRKVSASIAGRALICLCKVSDKDCVSITLRVQGKLTFDDKAVPKSHPARGIRFKESGSAVGDSKEAAIHFGWEPAGRNDEHPISLGDLVDAILPRIEEGGKFPQGLLVVAGATGTGKSQIAKGLMLRLLRDRWKKPRRPHVVTFEDPVESEYLYDSLDDARKCRYDYTAREKHPKDDPRSPNNHGDSRYPKLADAVLDAMRQTPAVFYCGEAREDADWKHLLWLANTGHLVVTTTHASSVIDFYKKLAGAVNFRTPADRSEIANRICGVIHLEAFSVPRTASRRSEALTTVTLPSIWRRTPCSVSELVADGLASITPHVFRKSQQRSNHLGSLGRSFFADHFKGSLERSKLDVNSVTRMAVRSDLLGI